MSKLTSNQKTWKHFVLGFHSRNSSFELRLMKLPFSETMKETSMVVIHEAAPSEAPPLNF